MIKNIWNNLFLVERPSISLSAFRIVVALTVGFVMLPTFCHLEDTYLSTAYKTFNGNFFPIDFIIFIQKSPDWLVVVFVCIFCLAWASFLIGFLSQMSCIIMALTCYYFYALNTFAMATLSWDILLVTVFLMCVTNYHSDYFSIDCLLRRKEDAYKRKRPYFLQRLLQIQIGFTFFYTALHKITVEGNWLTANPIYYLMNYPKQGVVKYFILKDFLMDKPQLCYAIGVFIVVVELLMIVLLFARRTRVVAIYLGILFHICLILTLDVPATFFFLFPPQLLLFINPEKIVAWIEQKREDNRCIKQPKLIYDGKCQFCQRSVNLLKIMDLFQYVNYVDLHTINNFKTLHPDLTKEDSLKQIYLIDRNNHLIGGFYVFKSLSLQFPMLYVTAPILFLPGVGFLGSIIYRFIANNRYLLLGKTTQCDDGCSL